jgi:chromosome segregation ATPase
MTMEALAELLEKELEDAVEVKDKKSLHRYITILTDNWIKKETHDRARENADTDIRLIKSDVRLALDRMELQQQRSDERFAAMQKQTDDKFDSLIRIMEERFKSVDRRFDDVNRRFDDVNKRFEDVNKRFDDVNKRFDDANKRFDDVNKRFDDVNKRFGLMTFFLSLGFVVISLLVTVVPKML